jgi:hypothetical protein
MSVILATQDSEIRRITFWSQPWANTYWDTISKTPLQKKAGGVAQVVECLPSKCQALTSYPSPAKSKKTNVDKYMKTLETP